MRETTTIKSFGVALTIILMLVIVGGCERKIMPGNPFDEFNTDKENYSACYDDEEWEMRFTGDYPGVVTMDMVAEDGIPYTIEAIEGQVCVWFEETVSYGDASKAIKKSNGTIVAQSFKNGYYLVEVPTNNVKNFIDAISMQYGVDWVYPNVVFFHSMVNNYVLDTEYPNATEADTPPHGIIVKYALWDSDPESPLKSYNIGAENGKEMNLDNWDEGGICPILGCSHNEYFALKDISKIPDNEPIIINMSYGPALKRKINGKEVRIFWKSATDDEKRNYKENYVYYIKNKIRNLSPLKGKDYICVIAAGNDGIKDFDAEILSYLHYKLSPEEKEVIDKHFLIVTAGETEKVNQDYSNEMEVGHYDPWVTKVDISDFKYEGKKWRGTSFAAPRAAGILSSLANEMDLSASEVLEYAKIATQKSPDHILTKELLINVVESRHKNRLRNTPVLSPPRHTEQGQTTMHFQDELAGTKWLRASQTTESFGVSIKSNRMEWEFLEDGYVETTYYYGSGSKEISRVYKYYFDSESNKWMMWNWYAVAMIGRIEGETNEEILRARAFQQGLYYTIVVSDEQLIASDFSGYENYVFVRMN